MPFSVKNKLHLKVQELQTLQGGMDTKFWFLCPCFCNNLNLKITLNTTFELHITQPKQKDYTKATLMQVGATFLCRF